MQTCSMEWREREKERGRERNFASNTVWVVKLFTANTVAFRHNSFGKGISDPERAFEILVCNTRKNETCERQDKLEHQPTINTCEVLSKHQNIDLREAETLTLWPFERHQTVIKPPTRRAFNCTRKQHRNKHNSSCGGGDDNLVAAAAETSRHERLHDLE